MPTEPVGRLTSDGFRGYGCVFCAGRIPLDDPELMEIAITFRASTPHFWAHRACFLEHMHPDVRDRHHRIAPPGSKLLDLWE